MRLRLAPRARPKPLTHGRVQLQSHGAGIPQRPLATWPAGAPTACQRRYCQNRTAPASRHPCVVNLADAKEATAPLLPLNALPGERLSSGRSMTNMLAARGMTRQLSPGPICSTFGGRLSSQRCLIIMAGALSPATPMGLISSNSSGKYAMSLSMGLKNIELPVMATHTCHWRI